MDWKKLGEELRADEHRFYCVVSGDKEWYAGDYSYLSVNGHVEAVNNYVIFKTSVVTILQKKIDGGIELRFISGNNRGVDAMTESLANDLGVDVYRYEADWDTNGRKAGFVRNEEMFFGVGPKKHKGCILFWNGENHYTLNQIYQAYLFGVPCRVYNYRQKRWLSKEEIEAIQYQERNKQIDFKRNRKEGN